MKQIIIIPTYNEKDNISPMIDALAQTVPESDILFCDDSSPDGSGTLIKELATKNPRVHLSSGPPKGGLGPAYIRGFKWALENGYDRIAQMDCDFSHDPKTVPVLFRALDENDLAIGSRYVLGGGTVNWPWYRKLISKGGSLYARTILGAPLDDFTGGFKAWRAEALKTINLTDIISNGYSFSVELNYQAFLKGFRIVQIPITFVDRRIGETKMSKKIFFEAVLAVWKFRMNRKNYL